MIYFQNLNKNFFEYSSHIRLEAERFKCTRRRRGLIFHFWKPQFFGLIRFLFFLFFPLAITFQVFFNLKQSFSFSFVLSFLLIASNWSSVEAMSLQWNCVIVTMVNHLYIGTYLYVKVVTLVLSLVKDSNRLRLKDLFEFGMMMWESTLVSLKSDHENSTLASLTRPKMDSSNGHVTNAIIGRVYSTNYCTNETISRGVYTVSAPALSAVNNQKLFFGPWDWHIKTVF